MAGHPTHTLPKVWPQKWGLSCELTEQLTGLIQMCICARPDGYSNLAWCSADVTAIWGCKRRFMCWLLGSRIAHAGKGLGALDSDCDGITGVHVIWRDWSCHVACGIAVVCNEDAAELSWAIQYAYWIPPTTTNISVRSGPYRCWCLFEAFKQVSQSSLPPCWMRGTSIWRKLRWWARIKLEDQFT